MIYDILKEKKMRGGKKMNPTMMMLTEGSVPTGDERDIVMYLVFGGAALALAITCAVLSIISKKKK